MANKELYSQTRMANIRRKGIYTHGIILERSDGKEVGGWVGEVFDDETRGENRIVSSSARGSSWVRI